MGKRILAICCTPYQLLVAAQVLACYYPGEEADLILSDQMSGARKLWEQAQDVWPYGQVYYLEERRLNRLATRKTPRTSCWGRWRRKSCWSVFSTWRAATTCSCFPTSH